jgi:hypothetical protein
MQSYDAVTWENGQATVGELVNKVWAKNPRMSTDDDIEALDESRILFGQVETIAVGPDHGVYNGHQRLKYYLKKYGKNHLVDVRIASRELTEEERLRLTVLLHAKATGRWDDQKLSLFDKDLLKEFGMGDAYKQKMEDEFMKLSRLFGDEGDDDGEGEEPGEVSDGSLLNKLAINIDDPRHIVEAGQVWQLGEHVLIIANVLTEWEKYIEYLVGDVIFAPYPGPFVPLTKIASSRRIIMVQPDVFIAGHILDRFEEINGEDYIQEID